MIKKLILFIFNIDYRRYILVNKGYYRILDDKKVIDYLFKYKIGRTVNWDNPMTFNEKLQWIKVYDRNPLYTRLVDKINAKNYVREMIGDEYIIPTIGVYNSFDEIPFDLLPDRFVIKCNHDSGGVVICEDKKKMNYESVKKKIEKSLKRNFFWVSREWAYKDITPRIVVEEYLKEVSECSVPEYKIFCFDGKAKMIDICMGKAHTEERTNDYCDLELNRLPFTSLLPNSNIELKKPKNYDLMISLAEKLSAGFPEVRMDFYNINGKIYFGEFTFTHNAGMERFEPIEWDYKIGEWVNLPRMEN